MVNIELINVRHKVHQDNIKMSTNPDITRSCRFSTENISRLERRKKKLVENSIKIFFLMVPGEHLQSVKLFAGNSLKFLFNEFLMNLVRQKYFSENSGRKFFVKKFKNSPKNKCTFPFIKIK